MQDAATTIMTIITKKVILAETMDAEATAATNFITAHKSLCFTETLFSRKNSLITKNRVQKP